MDYAGDGAYPTPYDASVFPIYGTSFTGAAGPGTPYNWAIVYSYNNVSGYSSTYAQSAPFTCPVPNAAPTIDNVTISSSPVYPNGGNPSKYNIS
ncbi:hypothetical protein HYV30_01675, partial [Candidatus Kaiserbacteria bacterium]|nr:hypothetical protein [Candidatus Kaiserbacteria bacterium]